MPTNTETLTPAQKGALTKKRNKAKKLREQIEEAKRQSTQVPVVIQAAEDEGGAHSIDHGTILDNHVTPDTNKEGIETIEERENADLSFWNGSWTWAKSNNSYGNKPEDSWFVNPTPKLIGEVMTNAPTIYKNCEMALQAGEHQDQMEMQRLRFVDFLQASEELVSDSLDMLTSYQGRFFESVQRYIGLQASYDYQRNAKTIDEKRLEEAKLKKINAGAQCRLWACSLIALVEAYHLVVTDERAYNLSYNFSPLPPQDGQPPSREYGLLKWAIGQTLNKVGRRLARSVKSGSMDAERFRIPRPWMTEDRVTKRLDADELLSDFN